MKIRFKNIALRWLGRDKSSEAKSEKIRLTIRDGKLIRVYYPARLTANHGLLCVARQQVACYEIKLNGTPLFNGLGA